MNFGILRSAATFAPLLCAAAFAGAACSSPPPPVPDAFLYSTIALPSSSAVPGGNPTQVCGATASTKPWVQVGIDATDTTSKPTTIPNGSNQNGSPVAVDCTVSAAGGGFNIKLSTVLQGTGNGDNPGGSVSMTGTVDSSGGSNINASFLQNQGGAGSLRFQQSTCTISYDNAHPADGNPVAAGRIWAHLLCPAAENRNTTKTGGNDGYETCQLEATFLFENCNQ